MFKLKKRANILALRVIDPLEIKLLNIGIANMQFGHENIIFDTSNKNFLDSYEKYFAEQKHMLQEMFNSLDINYDEFLVDEDYSVKLSQIIKGI